MVSIALPGNLDTFSEVFSYSNLPISLRTSKFKKEEEDALGGWFFFMAIVSLFQQYLDAEIICIVTLGSYFEEKSYQITRLQCASESLHLVKVSETPWNAIACIRFTIFPKWIRTFTVWTKTLLGLYTSNFPSALMQISSNNRSQVIYRVKFGTWKVRRLKRAFSTESVTIAAISLQWTSREKLPSCLSATTACWKQIIYALLRPTPTSCTLYSFWMATISYNRLLPRRETRPLPGFGALGNTRYIFKIRLCFVLPRPYKSLAVLVVYSVTILRFSDWFSGPN